MSANTARPELLIDVFDQKNQRALVLKDLLSAKLVAEVLREFSELEHLGDNPSDYALVKDGGHALNEDRAIGEQLVPHERLVLVEREAPVPQGAHRPTRRVYLRDPASGKVYKLHWQPALLGRSDPTQSDNDRLAVNLTPHTTGLRVSRRHAQIVEMGGKFYVESLAPNNPTAVADSQGTVTRVERGRRLLHDGDTIVLERSQINLKFIMREEATTDGH